MLSPVSSIAPAAICSSSIELAVMCSLSTASSAILAPVIPSALTDTVTAAEPLNVVPEFNAILVLSTVNALATVSAPIPVIPDPPPTNSAAFIVPENSAPEPEIFLIVPRSLLESNTTALEAAAVPAVTL